MINNHKDIYKNYYYSDNKNNKKDHGNAIDICEWLDNVISSCDNIK